jgi:hypothetical protein
VGLPVVPLRWILIRDPPQQFRPQALLSTNLSGAPEQAVQWFVRRWQLETTFAAVRAQLGVETPWTILQNAPTGAQHKRAGTYLKYYPNLSGLYFDPSDQGPDNLPLPERIGRFQPLLDLAGKLLQLPDNELPFAFQGLLFG